MMTAATEASVPSMPLSQVLGRDDSALASIMIDDVELDSRKVRAGSLFLALPGELHDGRQFIEQAVANGCAAVLAEPPTAGFVDSVAVPLIEVPELREEMGFLAERFFRSPSRALHVVGTTGTNGKTTTSRLLAQLCRSRGKACGVIGTLGASLTNAVSEAANTTPDAISLQRQLADWRAQDVMMVSMEVSSHALVQGRVNGVHFSTAVFTNLSHDHLDYHGSMAAYGRAKLRLFASEGLRHALINNDDEFAPLVAASVASDVEVLTYSATGGRADVRIENVEFASDGVQAMLQTPWGSASFSAPLIGEFNLANLAAAVSAAVLSGEDFADVMSAVETLEPVAGRMQHIDNTVGLQVIIDYAHTPDALEQVLESLRPHVKGQLITVFGCGGDRDREKRQLMGRIACGLSDRVFVTSDNPRNEDPARIIADIELGCSGSYVLEGDRSEAILQAIAGAEQGDCIVIAGKGHEEYQLVEGERHYFSDAAQAAIALRGREVS
ncbi:MAG: UDP-N-acetylmuramoyl-L-alanyl-D-glutamate--2,6-diaminopimelate ligase [Halioglobus sp.]